VNGSVSRSGLLYWSLHRLLLPVTLPRVRVPPEVGVAARCPEVGVAARCLLMSLTLPRSPVEVGDAGLKLFLSFQTPAEVGAAARWLTMLSMLSMLLSRGPPAEDEGVSGRGLGFFSQGRTDIACHVIGCHLTQDTRVKQNG